MKLSSLFAPLALFSVASTLHAQSAVYLETAPLSFLRAFAITSVVSSTKGPLPIEPGASIPLDPDDLRPDHRITTDIGAPGYYSEASGDQSFWVNQSERAVLERLALQQQKRLQLLLADEIAAIKELEALVDNLEAQIAVATDLNEQTALKNQLAAAEERLSLKRSCWANAPRPCSHPTSSSPPSTRNFATPKANLTMKAPAGNCSPSASRSAASRPPAMRPTGSSSAASSEPAA